jgi:hypothetical protein
MYNAMLRHRYIPRKWKLIVQSMLYKAGDETDLNNYRAISLGEAMLKLLDKIVERISARFVDRHRLISKMQFGFQRERTVQQALLILDQIIDHATRNKLQVFITLLDIKKAFPSVVWNSLIDRLRTIGMSPLADYVELLYKDMQFKVATKHGTTRTFFTTAGVMEGMCTSPLLFALYIDTLLRWLQAKSMPYWMSERDGDVEAEEVHATSFADDLKLIAPEYHAMQTKISMVAVYGYYHNYNINTKKTVSVSLQEDPLDVGAFYIRNKWLPPNEHDPNARAVSIKQGNRETPFRVLGLFRTLANRQFDHTAMVRAHVIGVLYNLQRIPCTEPFAINIVRSMIDTQLTFAIGLAGYCNKFIAEIEQLTRRTLAAKFRTKT